MSWVYNLPPVSALLNLVSALCLGTAYGLIRRRNVALHRACMLTAVVCSGAFLASYLVYHVMVGTVHFGGSGAARLAYLGLLGSHTVLAAAVPVLLVLTLAAAWRDRPPRHRLLGRVTVALWLYVSVTGVLVYWCLRPYYPTA